MLHRIIQTHWDDNEKVYISENVLAPASYNENNVGFQECEQESIRPQSNVASASKTSEEPLYKLLDAKIPNTTFQKNQNSLESGGESFTRSSSFLEGCWRVAFFADKGLYSRVPYRPGHDFLVDISTMSCPPHHYQIRGRVYNMTVVEVQLSDIQYGAVQSRRLVFSSKFQPLGCVALPDHLMSTLIRNVSEVNYDSRNDILYLSGNDITLQAYRYSRSTEYDTPARIASLAYLLNIAVERFNEIGSQ